MQMSKLAFDTSVLLPFNSLGLNVMYWIGVWHRYAEVVKNDAFIFLLQSE